VFELARTSGALVFLRRFPYADFLAYQQYQFEMADPFVDPHPQADKNCPLTRRTTLGQYRALLGEPETQFSLTRAALSTHGAQKQILINQRKEKRYA
jgi:hypothetical protein